MSSFLPYILSPYLNRVMPSSGGAGAELGAEGDGSTFC